MTSSFFKPDSPCIGYCSTTYGDDICKGCGRTYLEVVNWIIFDDQEKAAVWERLEKSGWRTPPAEGIQATTT